MRTLIIAASLCAAYRLPPTPTSYWIWESQTAAQEWQQRHPTICLSITRVPDGWATQDCCLPHRWASLAEARAFEARHPSLHFDVIWNPRAPNYFTTECVL